MVPNSSLGVLNPSPLTAPSRGILGTNTAKGILKVLVGPLRLSISLRMETSGKTSAWQKAYQTWEVNWGPRSQTMSMGMLWRRNTWFTNRSAVSDAEGNLGRAAKCAALGNLSTMVSIVVIGKPVTKSKAMWDQEWPGTGSGWSKPAGGPWLVLFGTNRAG